jgi:hypothetical protein
VERTEASTPRMTQSRSAAACRASAIDVFPERGAPFRTTI